MPKYVTPVYKQLNYAGEFYDCNNFIHHNVHKGDSRNVTLQNDPPGMCAPCVCLVNAAPCQMILHCSKSCPKITFFVLHLLNTSSAIKECSEECVLICFYHAWNAQICTQCEYAGNAQQIPEANFTLIH